MLMTQMTLIDLNVIKKHLRNQRNLLTSAIKKSPRSLCLCG